MADRKAKYNATEARITRVVTALFLFAAIAGGVWVSHHFLRVPFVAVTLAALGVIGAVVLGVAKHRALKAGADFAHTVFGLDYWFFIVTVAAASQTWLVATLPVDYWGYSVPVDYVMLAVTFVLYAAAWDQKPHFKVFGVLSAVAGFCGMVMYQTFYNPMQNFISTRLFPKGAVLTFGWIVLALAAVALAVAKFKKIGAFYGVWKHAGVVVIFAVYWLLLALGVLNGLVLTWSLGGALLVWFAVLRTLTAMKAIK